MRALLELVSPTRCVSCNATSDGALCARCAQRVRILDEPRAAGALSLVAFAEPARALTLHVKRHGERATANAIGSLLASLVVREGLSPEVVTFVPGGRSARRRGFDHAAMIARAVGRDLGIPTRGLLRRASEGPRQADVPLERRRANVEHRFAAGSAAGSVLLVDDVLTTGATAQACVTALVDAGAARVDVVTWARTLLRRAS